MTETLLVPIELSDGLLTDYGSARKRGRCARRDTPLNIKPHSLLPIAVCCTVTISKAEV